VLALKTQTAYAVINQLRGYIMKNRSVASVIILTIVTLGIYGLVWDVKTKNEMNALGANIPTAWLLIIPIANIYWLWKYCEGVELVTKNKLSTIMSFVLFWLIGLVGMAIVQSEFNKVEAGDKVAAPMMPQAPTA
jgi:hypothetical protein